VAVVILHVYKHEICYKYDTNIIKAKHSHSTNTVEGDKIPDQFKSKSRIFKQMWELSFCVNDNWCSFRDQNCDNNELSFMELNETSEFAWSIYNNCEIIGKAVLQML
jgi:hypothetical protein